MVYARRAFKDIKQAITEAPVLVSPYFSKDFLIFSYAYDHNVVGVLLQRNYQNVEKPIAFFRKLLRDGELKYDIMEKHAYAMVKSLKYLESMFFIHTSLLMFLAVW